MLFRVLNSLVCVVFLFAMTPLARGASVNTIRYTGSDFEGFAISSNFAVNNAGTIVFKDAAVPSTNGLYARSSGGVRLTLSGSDFASAIDGAISLNDAGIVSFQSVGGATDGVYATRSSGGVLLTVQGNSFGKADGAPSVSSSGAIVFRGTDGIYQRAAGGGVLLTINGQNFSRMGRPAVNGSNDIAFSGAATGAPGDAVYVQRSGGAVLLTISGTSFGGSNYRPSTGQPKIIDNKKGLLVDFQVEGGSGRLLSLGDFNPSDETYAFRAVATFSDGPLETSISADGGTIAALAGGTMLVWSPRSNISGSFGPEAHDFVLQAQVSVGDTIAGDVISSLAIADGSALASGNVAFHATFLSGASGIYLLQVPEPVSMLSAATIAMLALRRRRVS